MSDKRSRDPKKKTTKATKFEPTVDLRGDAIFPKPCDSRGDSEEDWNPKRCHCDCGDNNRGYSNRGDHWD